MNAKEAREKTTQNILMRDEKARQIEKATVELECRMLKHSIEAGLEKAIKECVYFLNIILQDRPHINTMKWVADTYHDFKPEWQSVEEGWNLNLNWSKA